MDPYQQMRAEMMAECQKLVNNAVVRLSDKAITAGVNAALGRPQPAPVVNVAAPHVAVNPQVTVAPSEDPEPDIIVNVDMTPYATEMAEVKTLLSQVLAVLSQPITKTVHRDGQWITSVTETRQ